MSILLIKCPHTGRPISTGIEVDADTFAALPDVLSYLTCSAGSPMRGGRERQG